MRSPCATFAAPQPHPGLNEVRNRRTSTENRKETNLATAGAEESRAPRSSAEPATLSLSVSELEVGARIGHPAFESLNRASHLWIVRCRVLDEELDVEVSGLL